MDIRKPKPWHGVREFLKEYVIIVVGVLTALGAEQAVEWLHWRDQVQQAQGAMRLELQTDDGPQAVARVGIEKCLSGQLDSLQMAIEAGADRLQIRQLVAAYTPPRRTWDADAWRVAASSQVASHMPAAVMLAWSGPYRLIPQLADSNGRERRDLASLLAGRRTAGHASEAEADRWLAAIQNLREDNDSMSYGSLALLAAAKAAGAPVTESTQLSVLREMQTRFGSCVVSPDPSKLNFSSQLDPAGRS